MGINKKEGVVIKQMNNNNNQNQSFTTLEFEQPFSLKLLDLICSDLPNGYYEINFKHLTCKVKVWRGRWKDARELVNE